MNNLLYAPLYLPNTCIEEHSFDKILAWTQTWEATHPLEVSEHDIFLKSDSAHRCLVKNKLGWFANFDTHFPDVVRGIDRLPVKDPTVIMLLTKDSKGTLGTESPHKDRDNSLDALALRAYLHVGKSDLIFTKVKPQYANFYNSKERATVLPQHRGTSHKANILRTPHFWALGGGAAHGVDYAEGNQRCVLVILGEIDQAALAELTSLSKQYFPENYLTLDELL